jgi:membrane protein
MAPLLYAVATGLAAAWRAAATEHALLRRRQGWSPALAWRGGEAATVAAPLAPAQSAAAAPPASAPSGAPATPGLGDSPAVKAIRQAAEEPVLIVRWWRYARELFCRFNKDLCPVFAASLSFFGLISVIPVLLVAMAALGYMLHSPEQARDQILHAVQQLLPGQAARVAAKQLMAQIDFGSQVDTLMKARGPAGVLGILTLIWAAMQIFVSSVPAMNAAWEVTENRSWLKLRLVAFGLLVGAGALFLLSLLPSAGPDMVRRLHIPWLGLPEQVPWYVDFLFTLLAVAFNSAMFALIFRFLPAAEVRWREAAVGGVAMGALWELAKRGFSLYMATAGSRNAMFGYLGGVMILITWIYYTSMLLLLGAEVSKLYKDVWDYRHKRTAASN